MTALFRSFLRSIVRLIYWAAPDFFPAKQSLDVCQQENTMLHRELERSRAGALTLARAVQDQCRPIREAMELRYVQVIAERDRQIEELEEVADHDPLTGLYNRRGAALELDRVLSLFERQDYGAPAPIHELSILMMDLNNFKVVNDQYGHAAGDQVLITVSGHLKHAFRAEDIVLRKGGDEFVVYLLNADKTGAVERANKLAELMHSDPRLKFGAIQVSVSIGISHGSFTSRRGGLQILADVERLADAAMYAAKEGQRDFSGIVAAPDAVFSDTVYGNI